MISIDNEIMNALQDENKEQIQEDNSKFFKQNKVTMSLEDFIAYYDSAVHLNKLLDLLLNSSELNYNKEALKISFNCDLKIMEIVKELRPLEYIERYESLLEDK